MATLEEINKLNQKIKRHNAQRSEKLAEQKVLAEQLSVKLKNYSEEYGVDLSGDSLEEIAKKFVAHANKVKDAYDEECARAQKVNELIEEGDLDAAGMLLGIEVSSPKVELDFTPESTEDDSDGSGFSLPSTSYLEPEAKESSVKQEVLSFEEDEEGESESVEEEALAATPAPAKKVRRVLVMDDDDDEDSVIPNDEDEDEDVFKSLLDGTKFAE